MAKPRGTYCGGHGNARGRARWEAFLALPLPGVPTSHDVIAKTAGFSKQHIQQIEKDALRKLRAVADPSWNEDD